MLLYQYNAFKHSSSFINFNKSPAFGRQNFYDFLKVYDQATSNIQTLQNIEEVIYRYLIQCYKKGTIYTELMCSPNEFTANASQSTNDTNQELIDYMHFVNAIASAIERARNEFGIEARILMVLFRHNGPKACNITMQEILSYRHPYVAGIHLEGDELNFPSDQFGECYHLAKEHGLILAEHVEEHNDPITLTVSNEKIIDTSFAEPILKNKLLSHVELFETYKKLFEELKNFPNSRSFTFLQSLKSACSYGLIIELNYHLSVEFNSTTTSKLGEILLLKYQDFIKKQTFYSESTQKSFSDFSVTTQTNFNAQEKSISLRCTSP